MAPSRASYRSTSVAPIRSSYRSTSVAPSRPFYRSTSVAPVRASSVAPYSSPALHIRASSVAPYTSSYVTPARAFPVVPYSWATAETSSASPYSSGYAGNVRSQRAVSLPPPHVSFRSTPLVPRGTAFSHIDTSIPTRQFGTRLGVQKMETSVKPAIYGRLNCLQFQCLPMIMLTLYLVQ